MNYDEVKEYIDVDTGLGRVRGNKALYSRMLQMFLDSKEFDALEQALAENNLEKAGEVAHAIKGMSGNLALDKVFNLSATLMNQFRQGVNDPAVIDEYREALAQTRICAEKLISHLL